MRKEEIDFEEMTVEPSIPSLHGLRGFRKKLCAAGDEFIASIEQELKVIELEADRKALAAKQVEFEKSKADWYQRQDEIYNRMGE